MFNARALDKSVCLNSGDHVYSICKYLDNLFNIKDFRYIKIFKDNTCLFLTTESEWTRIFYRDFYQYGTHHKTINSLTSGFVLWSSHPDQSVFNARREFSGSDHGITLIEKNTDSCEIFGFSSTKENPQVINFYINNLDLLRRHTLYFKYQAKDLIKLAEKDRLILPKVLEKPKVDLISDRTNVNKLIKETPLANYYQSEGIMQLKNKQKECLYLITQGKTAKQVAKIMNLSPRTIEDHINIIKNKLNCQYKSELIEKAINSGFVGFYSNSR